MTPIVNGLESEFEEQVQVIRLNVAAAENLRLQQQYGLRGHPTFVVLDKSGDPKYTFVGPQSAAILREAITTIIGYLPETSVIVR